MSNNLISIKSFLGKYYPELHYAAAQRKYQDTELDTLFEQRFCIQHNKTQMVVDPTMKGLCMSVNGNEIYISKEFFDHPFVLVSNSIENLKTQTINPRSFYNSETFSTIAYLICQNQVTISIVGELEEPVYIRYKTDYEAFYNSIITFEASVGIDVDIVEEIESSAALNAVINYILNDTSKIKLTTFYKNNVAGISTVYRNIKAGDRSSFSHIVLGRGSSNVIDENRIKCGEGAEAEFFGVIAPAGKRFHSVLYVEPTNQDYKVTVDYRDILDDKSTVTFYPVILGHESPNDRTSIEVSNITLSEIPKKMLEDEVKNYASPIVDRAITEKMSGIERYYDNKSKFLEIL
jgi:hypothetical protein